MTGSRRLIVTALLAAAVGGGITLDLHGSSAAPATGQHPGVSTAVAVRTDLATTILTQAQLGYAPAPPVVNRLDGTYTSLPETGQFVREDQELFGVDGHSVVLMSGAIPAYRAFAVGMSPGPDIAQLQTDLIFAGYAHQPLTVGRYDWATRQAVRRWQLRHGYPPTGAVPLGAVSFQRGPVRVDQLQAAVGQPTTNGASPFQVTGTQRIVTAPVTGELPAVKTGDAVSIVLPTQRVIPGVISTIAAAPAADPSSNRENAGGNPTSAAASSAELIITPRRPELSGTAVNLTVQVSLTLTQVRGVIAVPITALLALAGGGYGVELVPPTGPHRLVAVTAGAFANTLVQVTSPQITAGTRVVVAT